MATQLAANSSVYFKQVRDAPISSFLNSRLELKMSSDSRPEIMKIDTPSMEIEPTGSDTGPTPTQGEFEPTSLQTSLPSRELESWDGFKPNTPEELLEVFRTSFNSSNKRLPEHLATETLKQGYELAHRLGVLNRKLGEVRSRIAWASAVYPQRQEASQQSIQELRNALNGLQVTVDRVCNACTSVSNDNGATSDHLALFNRETTATSLSERLRNELAQFNSETESVNFRQEAVVHAAATLSSKHAGLCSSMTEQITASMKRTSLKLEENEMETNLAVAKEDCRECFQEVGGLY